MPPVPGHADRMPPFSLRSVAGAQAMHHGDRPMPFADRPETDSDPPDQPMLKECAMKKLMIAAVAGLALTAVSTQTFADGDDGGNFALGVVVGSVLAPAPAYHYYAPPPVVVVPRPYYYGYRDYGYAPYGYRYRGYAGWRSHEWRERAWRRHEWREHHRYHDDD